MSKIKVTLDPGHIKGYNSGIYPSYAEGTAMFNLATYLKADLEATGLFEVYVTRQDVTQDPTLAARGRLAVTTGSKVFISLHSNAYSAEAANGVITFYSCKRPNSLALGKKLTDAVVSAFKGSSPSTYSRGCVYKKNSVGNDYFGVIRSAATGACVEYDYLIEHGFHTNKAECAFLNSEAGLKKIAEAECAALYTYFSGNATVPSTSTTTTPVTTPTTPAASTSTSLKKGSTYDLTKSVHGFSTAADAKAGKNVKTTVTPGTYYVYSTYAGMINLTKSVGGTVPGAWINPPEAASSQTTSTSSQTVSVITDTSKLTKLTMSSTNMPVNTPEQAIKFLKTNNSAPKLTCSVEELVYSFVRAGYIENIRWDIAFAQSIKETGYFKYGGQVLYTQNNFAGIGALNGGASGATFSSAFEGALAQMQHLKAYANTDDIAWKKLVDPRFNLIAKRGWAPYLEWLGASENPNNSKVFTMGWAVPGAGYGASILEVLYRIKKVQA